MSAGVGLLITDMMTEPQSLLNVSIVNENDVQGNTALQCRTNATPADPNDQDIGEWISPGRSPISIFSTEPVYILRLPMEVNLFLNGQLPPAWHGIYTCQIPDSDMNIRTLYAGIYSAEDYDDGEEQSSYTSFLRACSSKGNDLMCNFLSGRHAAQAHTCTCTHTYFSAFMNGF